MKKAATTVAVLGGTLSKEQMLDIIACVRRMP